MVILDCIPWYKHKVLVPLKVTQRENTKVKIKKEKKKNKKQLEASDIPMHIFRSLPRRIILYNKSNFWNIHASSNNICA